MWKTINSLLNNEKASTPNCLRLNGHVLTNDKTVIANTFNEYFTNIAATLHSKLPPLNNTNKQFDNFPTINSSIFLYP